MVTFVTLFLGLASEVHPVEEQVLVTVGEAAAL